MRGRPRPPDNSASLRNGRWGDVAQHIHARFSSTVVTSAAYRPDIDGLRAIAILGVVGFHVGLPGFQGGFFGVDVFFVISGFLITTQLLVELHRRGSLDVLAFFARRARRLLPAFFLVVATTLLLGGLFLLPINNEQTRLANSAVTAALYVSNFYFAGIESGYFDAPSSTYPLLHTWSLAVEEQFYLVWPLMLVCVAWAAVRWQLSLNWLILGILAIVVLASSSFAWWAESGTEFSKRVAFYALPSRAWELGIGAILAVALPALHQSKPRAGAFLAGAGLIAIVAGMVASDGGMTFPSTEVLLPTLGTAAIISGGWLAPRSFTTQVLAFRPLVIIGLISYSWYLWHWPLLAIARAHALQTQDILRDSVVAIAALGLAGLTYVFLENPIRSRKVLGDWSNLRFLATGAVASTLIIATASAMEANAERQAKSQRYAQLEEVAKDQSPRQCHHSISKFNGLVARSACTTVSQSSNRHLVVWGDSHANHAIGLFETEDVYERLAVLPRSMDSCPPLLDVVVSVRNRPRDTCTRFNREVLAEIDQLRQEGRLAGVVLSARWSSYVGTPLSGEKHPFLWRDGGALKDEEAATVLSTGLRSTLRTLIARGIRVLIVAPMPEQRFEVPACLARRSVGFCSVSRALAEDRRKMALQALQTSIAGLVGIHMWDPLPILCNEHFCLVEQEGVVMYVDDDHLTVTGARRLGSYLKRSSQWRALVKDANPDAPSN
jgi:peptidoglycan/LPS O-acetylase OafA/YrhL